MKVLGISPVKFVKTTMLAAPLLYAASNLSAKGNLPADKFEKSEKIVNLEPNISIEDMSPCLRLMNGKVYPALVVDLKNKQMYQYRLNTHIEDVHPVETAKRSSKGLRGLNVVKHVFKDKDGFTMIVIQELNIATQNRFQTLQMQSWKTSTQERACASSLMSLFQRNTSRQC